MPDGPEPEELLPGVEDAAVAPEVVEALGPGHPALARIASLQRSAGNQAVARMLEARSRQARPGIGDLPRRGSVLARDIAPGPHAGALGVMDIKMLAKNDAATGGQTGLDGTITFTPDPKSPYSSKIGLIQIVKFTDDKGVDQESASMPAASVPHLRTKEDKAAGVEGGYLTDVLHEDFGQTPSVVAPKGQEHTHYYEGGAPEFGFRRSADPKDIKAAKLDDFPSTTDPKDKLNFGFETVAKGDDNQVIYGAVKWAFNIRGGKVQDETHSFSDGASATFDEALEKHRDFYVHEPVTIYFDFNGDTPSAGEDFKFTNLVPYLTKFPDVRVKAEGFADLRGSAAHNLALAGRRAQHALDALAALGIAATRFDAPVATGITTQFSPTDPGGTPQAEEPNRRANRRVMLTFVHAPAPAPGP
jgi:outer membrane protein OmpA-like peptidoglycan-associated protein